MTYVEGLISQVSMMTYIEGVVTHVVVLAIAYALAFPIGWEREKKERSAGLRTFPLVALASCGFIQGTEAFLSNSPEGTARVVEGLITGVGFIGGGAILKHGASVQGTATAASLWATGAKPRCRFLQAFPPLALLARD